MYKYLIGIIAAGFSYKAILMSLDIDFFLYLLGIMVILISLCKLCLSGKLRRASIIWIIPFVMYCLFSSLIIALDYSIVMAIVGISSLLFYLVMWFFIIFVLMNTNEELAFKKYLYFLLLLGVINAVFAIYQYYFDLSLFNMNQHRLYGDKSVMALGGITKRAGSFLGSPQNLGIYLGIIFSLLIFFKVKWHYKIILCLLLIYAGLLTGSSAFIIFIISFVFCWYIYTYSSLKLIRLIVLATLMVAILLPIQHIENLNDKLASGLYLADMWEATASRPRRIDIYTRLLQFDGWGVCFMGHGVGMTDRLVEVIGQRFNIGMLEYWVPGSESYIIKLYYEVGLIGLVAFCIPYLIAIIKSYRNRDRLHRMLFACLIAIFVNLLFTPSFTGLTMSFFIWPFILYPLSEKVVVPARKYILSAKIRRVKQWK